MKSSKKTIILIISILMLMSLACVTVFAHGDEVVCEENEENESNVIDFSVLESAEITPMPQKVSIDKNNINSILEKHQFNVLEKSIYNELKEYIIAVANGKITNTKFTIKSSLSSLSWTKEELGCTILENNNFTSELKSELKKKITETVDFRFIHTKLLYDLPYDLFWYDKAIGYSYNYSYTGNASSVRVTGITISFHVSADYSSTGEKETLSSSLVEIERAKESIDFAKTIVEKYKNLSDVEKLNAYIKEIIALTDYNYSAADDSTNTAYSDPWQLIWAFDNDPNTQIVCEGFAKSFKYLCDISEFENDVECYLVSGDSGAGPHMWNVVRINGNTYFADLTLYNAIDTDYQTDFILGGTPTGNGVGYRIVFLYGEYYSRYTYTYRDDMFQLYGEDFLALAENNYHPQHFYGEEWMSDNAQHWRECYCGEKTSMSDHIDSGRAVTCDTKALCEICNALYGDYAPHSYTCELVSYRYFCSGATCTSPATYYHSCSCGLKGNTTFESGNPLNHTYNRNNTSEIYLVTPATCTSNAEYYYSCSCGASGSQTFHFGDKAPHQYTVQKVHENYLILSATCTNKAKYYYSCVCGATGNKTFEYGDVLEHQFVCDNANIEYLKSTATCSNTAVYYYSCLCGAKGTDTFSYGTPLDHNYGDDNMCVGCGHILEITFPEYEDKNNETTIPEDTEDKINDLLVTNETNRREPANLLEAIIMVLSLFFEILGKLFGV